jgi:LysM repeat protein
MGTYPGQDDSGEPNPLAVLWWFIPVGLVVALLLVGWIAVSTLSGTRSSPDDATAAAAARDLPPYWIVKAGDTYSTIAEKTGLTVEQLEEFNPRVDPTTIQPKQRLKLRLKVPNVRKRLGPRFWKVKAGQSFGSIAAKTGKPIDTLLRLNPKLKPEKLQVGDRVRLRR